jgi:hypothetical protein
MATKELYSFVTKEYKTFVTTRLKLEARLAQENKEKEIIKNITTQFDDSFAEISSKGLAELVVNAKNTTVSGVSLIGMPAMSLAHEVINSIEANFDVKRVLKKESGSAAVYIFFVDDTAYIELRCSVTASDYIIPKEHHVINTDFVYCVNNATIAFADADCDTVCDATLVTTIKDILESNKIQLKPHFEPHQDDTIVVTVPRSGYFATRVLKCKNIEDRFFKSYKPKAAVEGQILEGENALDAVLTAISLRKNVQVSGVRGTGKTTLLLSIAKKVPNCTTMYMSGANLTSHNMVEQLTSFLQDEDGRPDSRTVCIIIDETGPIHNDPALTATMQTMMSAASKFDCVSFVFINDETVNTNSGLVGSHKFSVEMTLELFTKEEALVIAADINSEVVDKITNSSKESYTIYEIHNLNNSHEKSILKHIMSLKNAA